MASRRTAPWLVDVSRPGSHPAPGAASSAPRGLSPRAPGLVTGSSPADAPVAERPEGAGFGRVLVGRERELAAIARSLAGEGPPGVVLVGPPGVGLTRLAGEALASAAARGWSTQFVRPAHPASPIRLGPVPAGGRHLICVDDAHLLAPEVAVRLHEIALDRAAVVVLLMRAGAGVPESIVRLWKDGSLERLEVEPLSRRGHDEVVSAGLGGQVDGSTTAQLWRLTRGNVRYLGELVAGGLSSGALARVAGVWRWRGPVELPLRLVDLVQLRIGDLSPEQSAALELVAAGEPAGIDVLIKAGAQLGALESLETAGVLGVRRSGRRLQVRCAHPLVAEVVRRRSGHLRTRSLHRQLAAAWVLVAGCRRDDALRLSISLAAGGDAVPPELGTAAAGRATTLLDFPLAERLARRAIDAGAGAYAVEILAVSLSGQGRADEVERLLAGFDTGTATEGQRAALAVSRAANLYWGLSRPAESQRVLDEAMAGLTHPRVRADVQVFRAQQLMSEGRFADGVGWMAETRLETEITALGRPYLAVAQVGLLAGAGRSEQALRYGTEALAGFEEPPGQAGPMVREELLSMLTDAHLLRGEVSAAQQIAAAGYQRATNDRFTVLAASWAAQLGKVALLQGRAHTALRYLLDAWGRVSGVNTNIYLPLVRRTVMRELAQAYVLVGDLAAAEAIAGEAEAASSGGWQPFDYVDVRHGDPAVWIAAARGNRPEAVDLAIAQADQARELGAPMHELTALHHAVRLGEAQRVAARMTELGARCDGDLALGFVRHAQALAGRDAPELEAQAEAFAALGANLLAAEAGAQASLIHEAAGRSVSARRAAALAQGWTAACERVTAPSLALLREPPGLTGRQRQIARLAAQGLSSRAIADELVLSVRTVDNALGQIYRRLGITNRAELGPLLGV